MAKVRKQTSKKTPAKIAAKPKGAKKQRSAVPVSPAEPASTAGLPPEPPGCLIVGIGASAGGLEAMEEFFRHMPPGSGMAFVVISHQHAGHVSLLPSLLGKCTAMPVTEATAFFGNMSETVVKRLADHAWCARRSSRGCARWCSRRCSARRSPSRPPLN